KQIGNDAQNRANRELDGAAASVHALKLVFDALGNSPVFNYIQSLLHPSDKGVGGPGGTPFGITSGQLNQYGQNPSGLSPSQTNVPDLSNLAAINKLPNFDK